MAEQIKASNLEKKFGQLVGYSFMTEDLELYILETFVRPRYTPSDEPWSMVVGVGVERAAQLIRHFHEHCYQIPRNKVKVAACNVMDCPSDAPWLDDYDSKTFGELMGDARTEFVWLYPFMGSNRSEFKYDLAYIRNPDFVQLENWAQIFNRALSFLDPTGALVTIIRENDAEEYETLLGMLKTTYGIEPVFTGPSGILPDTEVADQCHTIGIFKPNGRCL